jgi:hypothetical protein
MITSATDDIRAGFGLRCLAVMACAGLATSLNARSASGQTILAADGQTPTYTLINSAFGGTAEEVPDCSDPAFGPHITQSFDDTLNQNVFNFFIHVTPDNDRCINFDRQRNEIKTNSDSLVAFQGDTLEHRWLFKLDAGFQPSPNFTHIHQIKAIDGNNGAPLITLTPRSGSPNKLQLIEIDDSGVTTTLAQTDLTPFLGTWVEADEQATFDFAGSYAVTLTRVSDGAVLFTYSNQSIELWRTNTTRIRGKWGIYRSLNSSSFLRDEDVLYGGVCVAKAPAACPSFTATPDFSFSAEPSSQTIAAVASTTYTATSRRQRLPMLRRPGVE